jgi:hypothetical protein
MKISIIEFEGSTEELDSSAIVAEALAGRRGAATREDLTDVIDVIDDDDDDDADDTDFGASAVPDSPDAIPGVPAAGQPVVRRLLSSNPAAEYFIKFLATVTSWPSVGQVHGIKRRGAKPGDPLDYTRYLRARKQGSSFGGFTYAEAIDGKADMRLVYNTDEELAAIAPAARRLHVGHRQYRVSINIVDQDTLDQAIKLARLAYDWT